MDEGPHNALKRQNPGDLWTDVHWEKENTFPHQQIPSKSLPHSVQAQKPAGPAGFVELWTEKVKRGKCPQYTANGERATQAFMTTLPNLGMMVPAHQKLVQPLAGCH